MSSQIRIAIIVIRNTAGLWFAHQRSENKSVFPGLWALGAGGRIEPNETPSQGAQRELLEETGLNLALTFIETFAFNSGNIVYDVSLYFVITDEPVRHDASEWSRSGWRTTEELAELIRSGQFCPDNARCLEILLDLDP